MRLVLEVISGPFAGKQIEGKIGEAVSVGRSPKASVALGDDFMSGAHFAVICDSQGCRLRDLGSRNGTKLNGELITETALKDGDQVHAGHTDFIVRVRLVADGVVAAKPTPPPPSPEAPAAVEKKPSARRRKSTEIEIPRPSDAARGIQSQPAPPVKAVPRPSTLIAPSPPIESAAPAPVLRQSRSTPAKAIPIGVVSAADLDSYLAATPDGRLLRILSNQPQTLMTLIDAVKDAKVLELLRITREEHQSLYRSKQTAAIAPYLVRLPPRSELLKQMIEQGWGHEWGVYLTCSLSLTELREYFRTSLMVTMPDGMELFSRFYDPSFFRSFLETCTGTEAGKFFGPITSYFMEDKRPEILLQFTKSKTGAEKKGHLLSMLS